MPNKLKVSEIFGPTIQGEGPSLGKNATFIRLAVCNLACSWCDTKYTWDWKNYNPKEEIKALEPGEIAEKVLSLNKWISPPRVVITGGEPLLQSINLMPLLQMLKEHHRCQIELETAGTISPTVVRWYVDQFNVSPKLAHSGNPENKRIVPTALDELTKAGAFFKFVVQSPDDFTEIDMLRRCYGIPRGRIYIMPEGVTPEALNSHMQAIAQVAIESGYNLTTRLHSFIWGNKRGY